MQAFEDTAEQTFEGIDLLDPTKLVPEELAPVQPLGLLTLSGTPTNFFAESEQVAFDVGPPVPGIDVTDDPLLQVRLFSYVDTQLTRLGGPNFNQLPVNRPHAPVNDMLRDGMHQTAVHSGVAPYRPNSLDGGCPFVAGDAEHAFLDVPQAVAAGSRVRELSASFDDHFSQARLFWLSMSPVEQDHIVQAYTFELGKCFDETIRRRQLLSLARIDGGAGRRRRHRSRAAGAGPRSGGRGRHPEPGPVAAGRHLAGRWAHRRRRGRLERRRGCRVEPGGAARRRAVGAAPPRADRRPGLAGPRPAGAPHAAHLPVGRVRRRGRRALLAPAADARQSRDAKAAAGATPAVDPRLTLLVDEAFRHGKAIGVLGEEADAAVLGLSGDEAGVVVGDAVGRGRRRGRGAVAAPRLGPVHPLSLTRGGSNPQVSRSPRATDEGQHGGMEVLE